MPVGFKDRPVGSESKLRTYHDGLRILRLIFELLQHERPMLLYGVLSAFFAMVALALGVPVVLEFAQTGLVPRLPTAVLAATLALVSILLWVVGILLNGILRARQEVARLAYLRWAPPTWSTDP